MEAPPPAHGEPLRPQEIFPVRHPQQPLSSLCSYHHPLCPRGPWLLSSQLTPSLAGKHKVIFYFFSSVHLQQGCI